MRLNEDMRETYFEWSTGHQPETTLREMLEQFGVPSDEWQHLLKKGNLHPDVLDMTYNEAETAPDNEFTKHWD